MPGSVHDQITAGLGSADGEAMLAGAAKRLPAATGRLLQRTAAQLALRALARTPVRTGRARAAWVAMLEALQAPVPAGWQGPQSQADAVDEGRAMGTVQHGGKAARQNVQLINRVPYVLTLELGGRGRPGHHMVRRSMLELRRLARNYLKNLVAELR